MKNSTHRHAINRVSLDSGFSTVLQSITCSTSARPMIPPTAGLAPASGRSCLVNKEPICNSKEIRQWRNWMGMWKHFKHEKYSQSYLAVIYHRNLNLTNNKFSRSVVLWPIACSSLSVSLDDQKSGWATRGVWETNAGPRDQQLTHDLFVKHFTKSYKVWGLWLENILCKKRLKSARQLNLFSLSKL